MKSIRIIGWAVMVVAALAPCAATAQVTPYDIKGDVLGSSIETFKAKYRHRPSGDTQTAPFCQSNPGGLDECQVYFPFEKGRAAAVWETLETIANCAADLYYSFVDGKLWMIRGTFQQRDFQTVEAAFVGKFGVPKSKTVRQYQNAFGAKFDGTVEEWDNGVSEVTLFERSKQLDTSVFTVVHLELSEIAKKRAINPPPDL